MSSTALRALDVSHTSRNKPREVKPVADKVQQSNPTQVTVIRTGDEESLKKAETFRSKTQSQSSSRLSEQQAIAAYESIEKDQAREKIQMLLGVDTFV